MGNEPNFKIHEKIKSKYILEKIFDNLQKYKFLKIIKHCKKIQKLLNINIDNYKEYSMIEIEIIPIKNKSAKFINIINDEDQKYYHIYFNNNYKKEIKEYHLNEKDKVKNILIRIDYQVKSFYELFKYCGYIESINFKSFYRSNIINMSNMFYNCSSLKEINLSNFNTDNVTNMKGMFYRCSSLKKLNISNFNTKNVTDMSNMFYQCSSLKELNLSKFITDKVINMSFMFYDCSSLNELNISNFNINKCTCVRSMFCDCSIELQEKVKNQVKNMSNEAFY